MPFPGFTLRLRRLPVYPEYMKKEWFATWFDSPYYALLYEHRDEEEATRLVDNLLSRFQWKAPACLLDLACGQGRHSLAFSRYGLDVTGVDLSANSILKARDLEAANLHFFVHDMRKVFRVNYFDVICNLFTSFGYFQQEREHRQVVQAMYAGLKPGGCLVMDFLNAAPALRYVEANPADEVEKDGVRFLIRRSIEDQRILKRIQVHDGSQVFHFEESLHYFSWQAFVRMFEAAGLKVVESYGDYDLHAYNENESARMLVLFRKEE